MRQVYSVFLVATLALFWCACSSDDNGGSQSGTGGEIINQGGGGASGAMPTGGVGGASGGGGEFLMDSGAPDGSVVSGGTGGVVAGSGGTGGVVAGSGGTIDASVTDTGVPETGATETGPVTDAVVTEGGTDPEFESCITTLEPNCNFPDKNTAELIGNSYCKDSTMIPIPLLDGSSHGPVVLPGGPYGGKIEWNQGAGTPYVANENLAAEEVCVSFGMDLFAQPTAVMDEIKNLRDIDWTLYTIFRPACMKEGEKYPIISWANGTCGETHGYAGLLGILSSYGYVIFASNSTWTAGVTTADGTPVQVAAIDYAESLNEDPNSIFYQKLDTEKIGAMGHSQGAGATVPTANDPRVKSVIFWNSGATNAVPFLNVSGEEDGSSTLESTRSRVEGATQPGAWIYFHQILPTGGNNTGHLLLMEQPERVIDMAVAWWDWQLRGDQNAKNMFVGDNCGLCTPTAEYDYGHNALLQ